MWSNLEPILKQENSQKEGKGEEDRQPLTIVLEREGESSWPLSIKEIIERDMYGGLKLNDIILKLKKQNFHDFFDASVSYYHQERKVYIYCFYLPIAIDQRRLLNDIKYQKIIPLTALESKKGQLHCKLKFRKKIKSKIDLLKEEQDSKYINEEQPIKTTGKQKQKTIAEVIQKVALWRKLYTGFPDQKGDNVHFQLEDAAVEIGVIKKTLDDYLLQIRNGKRYGFNFQKMKDDKIGQLRSFVKQKKNEKKDKK